MRGEQKLDSGDFVVDKSEDKRCDDDDSTDRSSKVPKVKVDSGAVFDGQIVIGS